MSAEKPTEAPVEPELETDASPKKSPKKPAKTEPAKDNAAEKDVLEVNESLKAMGSEMGKATKVEVTTETGKTEAVDKTDEPSEEIPIEIEQTDETTDEEQSPLDNPETDQAVDDIIAEEGDQVLAAEDLERDLEVAAQEDDKQNPVRKWLASVWANPKARWLIITISLVSLLAAIVLPHSRYFILNTVGVRSSLSLRVVDGGTLQPLKNVTVRAGGASAQTDSDGNARLEHVRLGGTLLQIEKRAFSPVDQRITVGWGSNPLGEFRVSAVGTQYTFFIKDFLSGKPIADAEATSGDGNAASDEDGKLVLTLDTSEQGDEAQIQVEIAAGSYRTEVVDFNVNNKEEQGVNMVPNRKHVFVSKRSGKYDVYTAYADGKDEQRIVEGTGLERDDITLLPHQKDGVAALVSTREKVLDANGYLLSTLYLLNTQDGNLVKIDQSEQIKVIGWSDYGHLVYVKIAAGASGTDPKRHRLMSFNSKNYADTKELASSNSFNDVMMAGGKVYYAPSNIFQENVNPAMYGVSPDGSGLQAIMTKEVFTIVRNSYDTLELSTGDEWYTYSLGSTEGAKQANAPATQGSRLYVDNPSNDFSLWVDSRDGKGVLLNYDSKTKNETTLVNRSGLKVPMYWLTDKHVIFRVSDSKETADYIINTEGGEAKKITDVTNTSGVSRWFYY